MLDFERILVLAPHTDDGEFACGGSIAQWASRGVDVHYIAFSDCHQSIPDGWPADVLVNEVKVATKVLGVKPEHLRILDFDVRRFATARQEILQVMVEFDAELQPDLVLLPSVSDLHQDHQTIAM